MFYSSRHISSLLATSGVKSRVAVAGVVRKFVYLIFVILLVDCAVATDPPPAPRSATPFVRPTQYHLLPPIYRPQVDRVPTVEDLVPILDEGAGLQRSSGPIRRAAAVDVTDDWPFTEATHGRRPAGSVANIPARVGAFRPARVPPKYATKWELEQSARVQRGQFQEPVFRRTHGDAPEFELKPVLFERISSPFVNQPVQHMASPVLEEKVLSSGLRQIDYNQNMPVPDPFPSSTTVHSDSSAVVMSAPYSDGGETVHSADCPCDFCQSQIFNRPNTLFNHQSPAIVSQRRTTVQLDALVWWTDSSSLPVLATTSPAGTVFGSAGLLGDPATTSVLSDDLFADAAAGYRIQVDHDLEGYGGINFEFLQVGTRSENLNVSSDRFPILARPFIENSTGVDSSSVIAFPGTSTGTLQVQVESRFRTAAAHYYQLAIEETSRSDDDQLVAKFQIGPRIASLRETFWSQDHSFDLNNNSVQQRTDSLSAENLFVGGEVGLLLNRRFRKVDFSAGLSVALGANRQKFQSSGNSVLTEFGGQTTSSDSGFLISSVGAGDVNRNRFSVIPSAEFGIGFETRWGWKLSVGYDVLLWTNALRATDQLNSRLDTSVGSGPGAAIRPFPNVNDDSFLAHGISFGIERRW